MEILWPILLVLVLLVCWATSFFALPGNWLMLLAAVLYFLFAPVAPPLGFGLGVLIALLALAAIGELVEAAAGAMGAAKVGGSKRGAALALVGSFLGAVIGAFVALPIPILGPIVGALLFASVGALGGAILGEYWKGTEWEKSVEVGKAAFWGRLVGTLGKTAFGAAMVMVVVVALFF